MEKKETIIIQKIYAILLIMVFPVLVQAQPNFYDKIKHSEADSIRGMLTFPRTCYDVKDYHLEIKVDPETKMIDGFVDMTFTAVEDFLTLQVDLFSNMEFEKATLIEGKKNLEFKRKFNAVFINLGNKVKKGSKHTIRMKYRGKPIIADNAPWDGGFVWKKDKKGRDWIGVACEGIGASLWWPNKDHLSDEPEQMSMSFIVPKGLTCVSNGVLKGSKDLDEDWTQFDWAVSYPINNYNVTLNIAHYAHFTDTYVSKEDGAKLDLDYYVVDYNLEKAKKHFQQVKPTLEAFEYYFGKYPFWDDGYALVETPYLGMEHQGAIAYGNEYMRGYKGGMIPPDMDFDYIIVHETGHEYFGNSISCNDHAEMWIHESFTTYMEALFVEHQMGYSDAVRYLTNQRYYIRNTEPILGPMNVNWDDWEASDHYYKGAWVLHTLRHCINNDKLWFEILKEFHESRKVSNVESGDFFTFVNQKTGDDYSSFFEQYLVYRSIPTFEYELIKKGKKHILKYRWKADVDLKMSIGVEFNGQKRMLDTTNKWQKTILSTSKTSSSDFRVLQNLFLVDVNRY